MDSQTAISIILPARDTARYIEECLDSIVNQSYRNWELIAVNDASSDHTFEILKAYAERDNRIIAVDNPHPGLLNALRLGYKMSSGILIQRMDSDDIMPKKKLELMHSEWQKHQVGSVITGGTEYFSDEGVIGSGFKRYDAWLREVARTDSHSKEIYKECVIPSSCWLIHRDDFETIGGFNHDDMPEDYDLCFRFYKGGLKIVGLDEVLHYWRDRPDRISRTRVEYRDNRFFHLKVRYFFELERDDNRPLIIWGAGQNGKDLVKLIKKFESHFHWITDNVKKIGQNIYDVQISSEELVSELNDPQVIVVVSSPDDQFKIENQLHALKKIKGKDYWFYS